jgi:hypothetical protein
MADGQWPSRRVTRPRDVWQKLRGVADRTRQEQNSALGRENTDGRQLTVGRSALTIGR